MTIKRRYVKPTKIDRKYMKLVKIERVKAPTVKGQPTTIRKYKLKDEPTEVLIIGDEGSPKGLAVFVGYTNIGYFNTLDAAKNALWKKYG